MENLQQTIEKLKKDFHRIQERADQKQSNSRFSEEISLFEGMEKRLIEIEETRTRNISRIHEIINMVGSLSQKLDSLSSIISESIDESGAGQAISTSTLPHIKGTEESPICSFTDEELRLELNPEIKSERPGFPITSKQNIHQSSEDQSDSSSPVLTERDTNINKKNVHISHTVNKKSHETKSENILIPTRQKSKVIKRAGYKVRDTKENEDNRISFRLQSECYQGVVLQPVLPITEKTNQPARNVFKKQSSLTGNDSAGHSHGSPAMMTMAKMAERDYDGKRNTHSLAEWTLLANQTQMEVGLKMVMNLGRREREGHDYVLLLDTSESMRGEKFDMMITTALNYVEGVKKIASQFGVRDNVGLACFGEETKLSLTPSTDYDTLKSELSKLQPHGPSPLAAGLLMALAGTHLCGSVIGEQSFKPIIILMTDGMPTNVEAVTEKDNTALFSSPMLQEMLTDQELNSAISSVGRRVQIFGVPFGSSYSKVLNRITSKTHGKIIPHTQIDRLCRMTLNMCDAAKLASELESATEINKTMVKQAVTRAGYQSQDSYDDITELVMRVLDPSSNGRFKQTKWPSLPLGSRVRRGPHWHWKNQDSNMAGTVIGGDSDSDMIWVEWDHGYKNCYAFSDNSQDSDLKIVNEPRILVDDPIAVGCKVKRGKKWKYGEQDGGKGSKGTVLKVEQTGKVVVFWEKGRLGTYRFDEDEIKVCNDNGQTLISSDAENTDTESTSTVDMPLILPTHNIKDVTSTWQYQDKSGQWKSYDDDTNFKIEKAFSRNPHGKCIIEIDKAIYRVILSKMVQEHHKDKSIQPVRRLENLKEDDHHRRP